jgi:hypothetical protein
VLAWLKQVWSGQLQSPENFNWHGFAEAAAFDARSNLDNSSLVSSLSWAEVATSVYEHLGNSASESAAELYRNSSMLLRTAMIAKLGSVPGNPVLDIDQVVNWFFNELKISPDEANKKATNWRNCNIQEIRELRKIKNRLNIISVLIESDKLTPNQKLSTWLSLKSKLP